MNEPLKCPGFQAAGMAAGIKKNGASDLGLIYSLEPAVVAGAFTRNRIKAAPVVVTQSVVGKGKARAVIVNSGNANCCTGANGMADAHTTCELVADNLGLSAADVMVASTGVIGQPMPMDKLRSAVPALIDGLSDEGFEELARAMMTTDTVPKLEMRQGRVDGHKFTLLAVAKGAGMIRPDMATMLCFVCTDAQISGDLLQQMLVRSVDRTLNTITIDGDTSTNDMVLIMANGLSGASIQSDTQQRDFQQLLDDLLMDLSKQLVKDGEGVTKVVEICVKGALSDEDAWHVADTVAHSPLVKTAFFGEDANWGRIMGAVGRAGVEIDPGAIDIYFDDVRMVKSGQGCGEAAETDATVIMKRPAYVVTVDLHLGSGKATMITCDFSIDYVKINADYRS